MKIRHVAFSDIDGGAARAAYRVHQCINLYGSGKGISSDMRVIRKRSNDPLVFGGPGGRNKYRYYYQRVLNKFSRSLAKNHKTNVISTAWPSSGLGKELNNLYKKKEIDIVNLHWLGDLTLSIKEIGRLKMPLTWRLADQWAFCGFEHYTDNLDQSNEIDLFQKGYDSSLISNISCNLSSYYWNQKIKFWKNKINIIAPTNWIADCARKSILFKENYISVIPTPIDLKKWSPIDKKYAKKIVNLPLDKNIILFGAIGGINDKRKGGDLLIKTLSILKSIQLKNNLNNFEVVVFGENSSKVNMIHNIKTHFIGKLYDDVALRLYYSAADLFILPSRKDNLPGTGIESLACGTPIAAFNVGGIPDIVDHNINGILVEPFDCDQMANEISKIFNKERLSSMSRNARIKASTYFNPERISKLYFQHYESIRNKS